ncbi:MAG TPA: thymidine phosphorylase [Candidatus Limnocylindria bacterium]|nr:thymidine phosphorylase [Candidatus Limnocylindria bacterium]
MALIDVINDKKHGRALTREQLREFADAAADPNAPDYQLAALLMAVRLMGMTPGETAELTQAMAESGHMLRPDPALRSVDKHSTGGVGDTTTLILAPLVAACGGTVIKMSGRGLGHTGGTIDKLESIPGFRTDLPEEEFLRIAREVGCCVVGQSGELAPADKRLYALRDVTGTVDSIPLIASSIMSKKLAGGASGIVLDVKVGSGALMKTLEECLELARAMADIGRRAGRSMAALVTGMDEPLGNLVGNALEVREAIDVLAGRAGGPLLEVSLELGALMLTLAGRAADAAAGRAMLEEALSSGRGLQKLEEMVTAQGGDARVCRDPGLLPQAPAQTPVPAPKSGYVARMDAERMGLAARELGAGRVRKEDAIDPAAGFVLMKRIGDRVEEGEPFAVLHHRSSAPARTAADMLVSALTIDDRPPSPAPLIRARILPDGKEILA